MGILSKLWELTRLVTFVPAMMVVLFVDRKFPNHPFCSLPFRNSLDVVKRPHELLFLLRRGGKVYVSANALFVSFTPCGGADAEPDKNATVIKGRLVWLQTPTDPSSKQEIDLFIKTPTGRPIALWAKALAAVFVKHQKEISFFQIVVPELCKRFRSSTSGVSTHTAAIGLQQGVPLNVAECLFAKWDWKTDTAIIIQRAIDVSAFEPIPDWKGVTPVQLGQQLRQAAMLHAITLNTMFAPLDYVKERVGLDWIGGLIDLFGSRLAPIERKMWRALQRYFSASSVRMCLSHADCRPGNMLFHKRCPTGNQHAGDNLSGRAVDVIMTDWEAVSFTPLMWDCTYSMICGLDVDARRASHRIVIKEYLFILEGEVTRHRAAAAGHRVSTTVDDTLIIVPHPDPTNYPAGEVITFDVALQHYRLLSVVIAYFGWLLKQVGGVGETQGNTADDCACWSERVAAAVADGLEDTAWASKALQLSHDEIQAFLHSVPRMIWG